MKSLLKIDGFYYFITGGNDKNIEVRSAIQLILPKDSEWAIKQIDKSSENDYITIKNIKGLTEELVDNTFDCIINKLQNTIYKKSFLNIDKNIEQTTLKFNELNFEEKSKTLLMLVKAIRYSGTRQNLKHINLKSDYGRISGKTNNLNRYKEFKLVNQSITGLFENEVDLLKL